MAKPGAATKRFIGTNGSKVLSTKHRLPILNLQMRQHNLPNLLCGQHALRFCIHFSRSSAAEIFKGSKLKIPAPFRHHPLLNICPIDSRSVLNIVYCKRKSRPIS